MPRSVLYTTAALVVLAAVGGFRLVQQKLHFENATGVIEAVAAVYVETHGGAASDCFGWLDVDGARLNVRCGEVLYQVDRFGRITEVEEGGA